MKPNINISDEQFKKKTWNGEISFQAPCAYMTRLWNMVTAWNYEKDAACKCHSANVGKVLVGSFPWDCGKSLDGKRNQLSKYILHRCILSSHIRYHYERAWHKTNQRKWQIDPSLPAIRDLQVLACSQVCSHISHLCLMQADGSPIWRAGNRGGKDTIRWILPVPINRRPFQRKIKVPDTRYSRGSDFI